MDTRWLKKEGVQWHYEWLTVVTLDELVYENIVFSHEHSGLAG